ncbi:hypothetical protein Tco_1123382 [Tanacetum coccineum]|uniref:Uncharacterized protein n=1 Tax=Tanacetum coccineum TaxID=301880 RepID=A0ABQ5J366_9ASTR
MQASDGNIENVVPATSTYQRNLPNHTAKTMVHNLSPTTGFEWGCFSIVSDSTADNSRHLKKILQWSSMLDMNLVRESVPSFDQTRLVLEFIWNSNIQERTKDLEVVQYVKEYKHKGKYEAATTTGKTLINEENRKMSGSGSVAKKVELKANKCDIHPDDGLEQKLQDPIATGSSGKNVCQGITLDAGRGIRGFYLGMKMGEVLDDVVNITFLNCIKAESTYQPVSQEAKGPHSLPQSFALQKYSPNAVGPVMITKIMLKVTEKLESNLHMELSKAKKFKLLYQPYNTL